MQSVAHRIFALLLSLAGSVTITAQSGNHTLYGDLMVDETKIAGIRPLTFDIILYSESGVLVSRQPVSTNGRYRFNNLPAGVYLISIEMENAEVARVSVDLRSPLLLDVRRDIAMEWRTPMSSAKSSVVSASDVYNRTALNHKLFRQAEAASKKKQFAKAAELLRRIIENDAKDFGAWVALANIHFMQRNYRAAENEYLHAIDARPAFFLALLNLGRLELTLKKFDVALEALARAVKARPDSPDANYFLGESYLQMKRGSLAVVYLAEALRLDPQSFAEAHLRLATLYNAAGMKDKAAAEYEQFLKKRPDDKHRKALKQYISQNKKH